MNKEVNGILCQVNQVWCSSVKLEILQSSLVISFNPKILNITFRKELDKNLLLPLTNKSLNTIQADYSGSLSLVVF